MKSQRAALTARPLLAPREHLGVLIERCDRSFACDVATPSPSGARFRHALPALRGELRGAFGLQERVVAAGHQAEFSHAGVFAKELAVARWCAERGESGVFLIVDSDLPKQSSLRVPEIAARGLRRVEVRIPGVDLRKVTAAQPPQARGKWVEFFAEIARRTEHYEASLLRAVGDAWCGDADLIEPAALAPISFVEAFDRGRRAALAALDSPALPAIRVSQLCTTVAFREFIGAVCSDAERFALDHNSAIHAYRERHDIRAHNRPIAPLEIMTNRVELPFWLIRADGVRERLFAQRESARFVLAPLRSGEWIAPRALALTAFVRLALADEFVHGIGGALYDELTEQFTARYFGVALSPVRCVTATLHLPLPNRAIGVGEVLAAVRRLRDLRHNPQRVAKDAPVHLRARVAELAAQIRAAREQRAPIALRRELHEAITEAKNAIRCAATTRSAELESTIEDLRAALDESQIATDREYFYALHPRATLRKLASRLSLTPDT